MSGTNTTNDVIIDEAIRLKTAELAELLEQKEQAARAHSYENSVRKIPYIIEQAVAVHNERMNADLNRRSDLSPDEKRERKEEWAHMANFIQERIPTLEEQEQWEAVLAHALALIAARAARAAGFNFGDNNKNITDNMKRLRDTMASPGTVNENVTAFIQPMIATLQRDDLSPTPKQMLKTEWILLFNDYNDGLTNAICTSEQESAGIAEKRAAAVAAIADIEKADKAVVGLTAAATTTAKVLSTTATATTTTTADQPAAELLPNRSGSAGSVIPSSENDVDGDDKYGFAAIDKEVHALKSHTVTTMTQLKTIRSQLKTKNNEAATLQKQNAELRLEIDQKNQTIYALQAEVALHPTKIKGHDAIP